MEIIFIAAGLVALGILCVAILVRLGRKTDDAAALRTELSSQFQILFRDGARYGQQGLGCQRTKRGSAAPYGGGEIE